MVARRRMRVLVMRRRRIRRTSLMRRRMCRGRRVAVRLAPRVTKGRAHLKDKDKVPRGRVVLRARASMAGIGLERVWAVRGRVVSVLEGVRNRVVTTSKAALILDILKEAMTLRFMVIRGNSSTGNEWMICCQFVAFFFLAIDDSCVTLLASVSRLHLPRLFF